MRSAIYITAFYLIIFLVPVVTLGQIGDEIILRDGTTVVGLVDRGFINENANSIRIKSYKHKRDIYYHVDQINFVRAWNGKLLYPIGVVANLETNIYHLPNVLHLPADEHRKFYGTMDLADSAGYIKCKSCFNERPRITNYTLEMELAKELNLIIKSTNEILYEHPMLGVLQDHVKHILATWPEKLKGYDYRVQIIRSPEVNASAVPGGNIYINTGLLELFEYPEEIEAVLAHEIAHVERRHGLQNWFKRQEHNQKVEFWNSMISMGLAFANEGSQAGAALAIGSTIAGSISTHASELALHGYTRENEQEADMLAQLRLHKLGRETEPILHILDKAAVHTKTREGYIQGTNGYSSHPDIRQRIAQLQNIEFFEYETPMKFSLHSRDQTVNLVPGFLEISIQYAFMSLSSTSPNRSQIILMGTATNHNAEVGFRINGISINVLGGPGVVALEGLDGLSVDYASSANFIASFNVDNTLQAGTLQAIKNKALLPYSTDISAMLFIPGEDPQEMFQTKALQCTMVIK